MLWFPVLNAPTPWNMYIPVTYGRTYTPQFISASKISLFPATMTMLESEEIYDLLLSPGSGIWF